MTVPLSTRKLGMIRQAALDVDQGLRLRRSDRHLLVDVFAGLARDVVDLCDLVVRRTRERDEARREVDRLVGVLSTVKAHPEIHRIVDDELRKARQTLGVIPAPGTPEAARVEAERRQGATP